MPLLPVLVDVDHAQLATAHASVMLEACSKAAAPARCELRAGRRASVGQVTATASWRGEPRLRVRIVVVRTGGPSEPIVQELAFREEDEPGEQWRSLGLTIGVLAAELDTREPPSAPEARGGPTEVARPVPVWSVEAGAVGGTGYVGDGMRLGAWLRGTRRMAGAPWMILLDVTHAWRSRADDEVGGTWSTVALGPGAQLELRPLLLGVRVHAAATVERIGASVALAGRDDRGARWVTGARGGLDLQWPAGHPVAAVVGAEAWWTPSATVVSVQDEVGATSPSTGVLIRMGVGVMF